MLCEQTQYAIHRLAVQIADEAARSDIETWCPSFTGDEREPATAEEMRSAWYDTSKVEDESAAIIQTAVSYLTLRGKIIRHPSRTHWMRPAGG